MLLTNRTHDKNLGDKLLRWFNLRDGEGYRTLSMFAFYTTTSAGQVWLEACAIDLFLSEYGASKLPLIYIASSGLRVGLGVLYTWLQRILPLRWVIVAIAVLLTVPLPFFWWGLEHTAAAQISGFHVLSSTILIMQFWVEASHALNDLNASITANQLFNIREVKRTYPLISSGVLLADVISGFSLPLLLAVLPQNRGLPLVILLSFGMMLIGAMILFWISQTNQQSFPDSRRRRDEKQPAQSQRLQGKMRRYAVLLLVFFAIAQISVLLVEFQFLSQLGGAENAELAANGQVAGFIGIFNGALGICELAMQWIFSSRLIDRMGVFAAVMLLPTVIIGLSGISMTGLVPVFAGVVGLRFLYELLHYTLFAGVGPFLFYSVPENLRDRVQSTIRGIAEPMSTALTGIALLGLVELQMKNLGNAGQNLMFIILIALSGIWLLTIFLLRSEYIGLLVVNAGRGQLSGSEVDLRELKKAVVETLEKPGTEASKRSCIELLNQIDAKNIGDILAPMLSKLPATLQHKSLEEMLNYPNPEHLPAIELLLSQKPIPEVTAVALRYRWLTETSPNVEQLRPYLRPAEHPVVRGTAASLVLRRGNPTQKAEATNTLRLMLTHKQKQERVMGCRALGEAVYLQALRVYIPKLLQDESLLVQCAVLEAIGATRLEEYYPWLLKGLNFKSTREASKRALVKLDNDALPMLVKLAEDIRQPNLVRAEAWCAIGQIGTPDAIKILIAHLQTSWGEGRRSLLRILTKIPQEKGIEAVLDQIGRRGIEALIDQELMFIGQIYAAQADLMPERVYGREADMLRQALEHLPQDAIDRLFLFMKFLYPITSIQAAAFNLQSDSRSNVAQGLEILDNTLDISNKRAFLGLLDRTLLVDKLQSLAELAPYTPMRPHDRVKHLLELRHFLSDWALACCFHLAKGERWSLTSDQILSCLAHPRGFVREAVLSYVELASSPTVLKKLLTNLRTDPDRIVGRQVKKMLEALPDEAPVTQLQMDDDDDMPRTGDLRPV